MTSSQYIHTKLGDDRRVAIPAKLCSRLGLSAGDPLVWEEMSGSLRLIPCSQVLREVQDAFTPYRKEGLLASEELILERREEAKREEEKEQAWLDQYHRGR